MQLIQIGMEEEAYGDRIAVTVLVCRYPSFIPFWKYVTTLAVF